MPRQKQITCSKCEQTLPSSNFYKIRIKKGSKYLFRPDYHCKLCRRKQQRKYYNNEHSLGHEGSGSMRKYQPIWEAIKENFTASLSADPSAQYRIIRAVRKEKDKDTGWKYICLEEGKKYKLLETVDGSLLTFKLVDVSPVSINSL